MKIPAFINNFNRLGYVKNMLEYLNKVSDLDIYIIDNNSTYSPLIEWYNTNPCKVIKLNQNLGCMAPWISGIINNLTNDYYIVSDPDLDLSNVPLDFVDKLKTGIDKHPERFKCALSIEYEDIEPIDEYRKAMIETEKKWWQNKIDDFYYICDSDTTLAIYKKGISCPWFTCAIRTDKPYTARHLPWYIDLKNLSEEDTYYLKTAIGGGNHPRYSSQVGWLKI